MSHEAIPQFSVGFPFENPLEGMETQTPVSQDTLFDLILLCESDISPDFTLPMTEGEGNMGVLHFYLKDGWISLITVWQKISDKQQVTERTFMFGIINPVDTGEYNIFEIVLSNFRDEEPRINDFGITTGEETPTKDIVRNAVMLNAEVRLEQVPDVLPEGIDDGTLRVDPLFVERSQALEGAIQEVLSEVATGDQDSNAEANQPQRVLRLSEPFTRKVIEVLAPIVAARRAAAGSVDNPTE
ncbi:MAG TPA: hypothetical protein VLE74_02370 [Candidatus Saccharimonadales bacterium]|nr:hypothetical protein [Candidatus Saccharimonadales bacterium]